MQNNPSALSDPFAEERKEYEKTIEDLLNELAESRRYREEAMEELFKKLAESEQDRMASAETKLKAEEERRLAEQRKQSAEEELRAWIQGHRDFPMVPASADLIDPFAKEREDYLKTIQELYDKVLGLEQREANESVKAEEEQQPIVSESDYLAQIREALSKFEDSYNEEKKKRASMEEELARCKNELEEAEKAIRRRCEKELEEEAKKVIPEKAMKIEDVTKDEGDWVFCE